MVAQGASNQNERQNFSPSTLLLQTLPLQESFNYYQMVSSSSPANANEQQKANAQKEILQKLSAFYQNYFEKKDANELAVNFNLPFDFTPQDIWSVNKRRLYMREFFGREQKKYLIAEAPNMFYAHYALAKDALQKEHYAHAALHFLQALRFRTLSMQESLLLQKQKNDILGTAHPESAFAQSYRHGRDTLVQKTKEEQEKRRRYWVLYDKSFSPHAISASEKSELQNLKVQLPNLKNEVQNAQKDFSRLQKEFVPMQKSYNQESADFLELMAESMLRQDENIRIVQKSAYQMHQYTRNFSPVIPEVMPEQRDLSLQDNLYTKVVQLDPQRYLAWQKLGEINAGKPDYEKAISCYEQSLPLMQNLPPSQKSTLLFYATYKKLSALSLLQKKFPQSAFYMQQAYQLQNSDSSIEPNLKMPNLLQLARLQTNYIGNYAAAFDMLAPEVKNIDAQSEDDLVNDNSIEDNSLRTNMQILQDYSLAARKLQKYNQFEAARKKGIAIHQALMSALDKIYGREKIIQQELKTMRFQQSSQNDSRAIEAYQKKNFELQEIRKQQQIWLAARNSLPVYDFYLSLSQHYQEHGNLWKAKEILQAAIRYGVEEKEARRQLLLLQKELDKHE